MKKAAFAVFIAVAVWFSAEPRGLAQQSPLAAGASVAGDARNSAMRLSTFTDDELRRLNPLVDEWVREGTLSSRTAYDDAERPGRRHEVFIQYYKGIPVYGADLMRQTERGVTVSIFGTVYSGIDIDVAPRLTAAQAVEMLDNVSGATRVTSAAPELTVLPTLDGHFELAYFAPMGDTFTYFIDANDGRLLLKVRNIVDQSAVGSGRGVLGDLKKMSTMRSGGVFRSRDGLRPAPILTLDARSSVANEQRFEGGARWSDSDLALDSDNDWTDSAVVDAHAHMGWVYDYFFKTHRYQGLNGRNAPTIGVVASRAALPNNAFFILPPYGPDGGGGMFFGESSAGVPLTILDIVAHELTHGVVHFALSQRTGRTLGPSFTTELGPSTAVFNGQNFPCTQSTIGGLPFLCDSGRYVLVSDHAGALNEGIADSFGTAVEFAYQPTGLGALRADYLMGEDLPELGTLVRGSAGPIRSLENPGSLVLEGQPTSRIPYPDHYSRRITLAVVINRGFLDISPLAFVGGVPNVLRGTDDGAVHWNSTIISHAFYLAIEGGTNRTSARTVQGVGSANRAQIEQVFFRALRDLIPSSVTFPQMAAALRQASVDLYGTSGTPTRAVDQALTAVGL